MREKVEEALKKVRPMLQRDGGDVELVSVDENGIVKVRLKGACGACPMSTMTLKMGTKAQTSWDLRLKNLKKMRPGTRNVKTNAASRAV